MLDLIVLCLVIGYAVLHKTDLRDRIERGYRQATGQIFQLVVDASKLEIESISITDCTEGAYTLSMRARIYNTGPVPAVIDSFTVALSSDMGKDGTGKYGTPFSFVTMPKMRVEPAGATMVIANQFVKISSMSAYDTFSRRLINSAEFPLYIAGRARVSALTGMVSAEVAYDKVVVLRGMNGLSIDLLSTRAVGAGSGGLQLLKGLKKARIETDVIVHNSSRVAVEMGDVHIAVVYRDATIAKLSAGMHLRPGGNNITLTGELVLGSLLKPSIGVSFLKNDLSKDANVEATVVGVKGEQCGWLNRVVKQLYTPINMDGTLNDLIHSVGSSSSSSSTKAEPQSTSPNLRNGNGSSWGRPSEVRTSSSTSSSSEARGNTFTEIGRSDTARSSTLGKAPVAAQEDAPPTAVYPVDAALTEAKSDRVSRVSTGNTFTDMGRPSTAKTTNTRASTMGPDLSSASTSWRVDSVPQEIKPAPVRAPQVGASNTFVEIGGRPEAPSVSARAAPAVASDLAPPLKPYVASNVPAEAKQDRPSKFAAGNTFTEVKPGGRRKDKDKDRAREKENHSGNTFTEVRRNNGSPSPHLTTAGIPAAQDIRRTLAGM